MKPDERISTKCCSAAGMCAVSSCPTRYTRTLWPGCSMPPTTPPRWGCPNPGILFWWRAPRPKPVSTRRSSKPIGRRRDASIPRGAGRTIASCGWRVFTMPRLTSVSPATGARVAGQCWGKPSSRKWTSTVPSARSRICGWPRGRRIWEWAGSPSWSRRRSPISSGSPRV